MPTPMRIELLDTCTWVPCRMCDAAAVVTGSFGLADMGLCREHLTWVETEWRMHAGADGMDCWADRDGRWHPARQFFTSRHVDALRNAPEQARSAIAQWPGGAAGLVGVEAALPCSDCGDPAVAAYEVRPDGPNPGWSRVCCDQHRTIPGAPIVLAAVCDAAGRWSRPPALPLGR